MKHQHIVHKINRRAEVERQNASMDEIERYAAPLFCAVIICAAAAVLWTLTAGYRDVMQHKLDTLADRQQAERISATLASCANGDVVRFGNDYMTCRIKTTKLVALQ